MTKEELEKEATEYALEWGDKTDGTYACCRDGYLAAAEPREKYITELKKQLDWKEKALAKAKKETKRIADRVNKDKRRLIRRKAELEAQIEKMKCCHNCKNCAYAGFEIICRTYDCVNQSKWEIKENDRKTD